VIRKNAIKIAFIWFILSIGILLSGCHLFCRNETDLKQSPKTKEEFLETGDEVSQTLDQNSVSGTTVNEETDLQILDRTVKEHQEMLVVEPGWMRLNSNLLGISFEYPFKVKGLVTFGYSVLGPNNTDPAGSAYSWNLKIIDAASGDNGYTYGFAGGISADFMAGRMRWFTDFYELDTDDYTKAAGTFKTRYGTDAVLIKTPFVLGEEDTEDKGMTLKVNLPIKSDTSFKGIAIYFKEGISTEDAYRVVSSLEVVP
jgi:hypothetical protein